MRIESQLHDYAGQPLNRQILMTLLKDYKRPYDKISELVRQEILTPVKKGIFITGHALGLNSPSPFLIANHLKGPSYISMESALSHWGLIPELVFEISSATPQRSETIETQIGRFSFVHLPLPYYAFGQQQIQISENQVVLMAGPEKALCDKIVTTSGLVFRSILQMKAWLTEDMRIDREEMRKLQPRLIRSWLTHAPKTSTLKLLVNILEDL